MKILKNFILVILVTASMMTIYSNASGGGHYGVRKKCRDLYPFSVYIYKYVAVAVVYSILPPFRIVNRRGECDTSGATANLCYIPLVKCDCIANSYVKVSQNTVPIIDGFSRVWFAANGDGYTIPPYPPSDAEGLSRGKIRINPIFDTLNHSVNFNYIDGFMSTALNTNYGCTILAVVWIDDESDSIITPNKVLWKGNARLEFGNLVTDGIFNPGDFNVTNDIDSITGIPVRKAIPVSGLSKTLPISNSISLDSIQVSVFLENGYGAFNESDIIKSDIFVNISMIPEGFYNPQTNKLNMRDTINAYLRNVTTPYSVIDSGRTLIDSLNFTGVFEFQYATTGKYYIQMKHRNSIETWSKSGGDSLKAASFNSYNFTNLITQAYGNNMKLKGNKYCIYSGDVNQNGVVDLADMSLVDNDAYNFVTGYVNSDVNGDGYVDLLDALIVDNNSYNFVSSIRP